MPVVLPESISQISQSHIHPRGFKVGIQRNEGERNSSCFGTQPLSESSPHVGNIPCWIIVVSFSSIARIEAYLPHMFDVWHIYMIYSCRMLQVLRPYCTQTLTQSIWKILYNHSPKKGLKNHGKTLGILGTSWNLLFSQQDHHGPNGCPPACFRSRGQCGIASPPPNR